MSHVAHSPSGPETFFSATVTVGDYHTVISTLGFSQIRFPWSAAEKFPLGLITDVWNYPVYISTSLNFFLNSLLPLTP